MRSSASESKGDDELSDSVFYIMIDIFVTICGIYVIAQYIFMVTTKELRKNLMLPKELPIERCKDQKGYIKAMGTKQLLFGIAATVCGLISLMQDLLGAYNMYVSMAAMIIFIVLVLWYGRASKKAIAEFWN
ncbi:MAG: hypothetical protein LUH00_12025 [Lachnospiraceae bacterium]|nr:hypothetical protein [Lachnospiraceae bacterium]